MENYLKSKLITTYFNFVNWRIEAARRRFPWAFSEINGRNRHGTLKKSTKKS